MMTQKMRRGGLRRAKQPSLTAVTIPNSAIQQSATQGTPFSNHGFQAMVERAAKLAGFGMKIHPHMLRHSCGYKLANDGVDTRTIQGYLGHKSIQLLLLGFWPPSDPHRLVRKICPDQFLSRFIFAHDHVLGIFGGRAKVIYEIQII
jgi:Phage integrase family